MFGFLKFKIRKSFSLIEVMIVVAVIGVVCAIALPNFARMRTNSYRDQCIVHLRSIASAKEHCSLETGAADTATPTAAQLNPYIKDDITATDGTLYLVCPLDPGSPPTFATSYSINNISTSPTCNIDATHVLP